MLSEIASSVDYIVLETNENCLIDYSAEYIFTDSLIFVQNRDHILKFSIDGKFITRIGSLGRGPGEIMYIQMVTLIPEQEMLIVHTPGRLTYYSYDGSFIKSESVPYDIEYIKIRNDFSRLERILGGIESEEYSFRLTDANGAVLSLKKNYNAWKNYSGQTTVIKMEFFKPLYSYRNSIFFKTLYSDTVFTIVDNKIVSSYCFDMGKYKLPDDKILEQFSQGNIDLKSYSKYYVTTVFECSGRKFISAGNFNNSIKHFIVNKSNEIDFSYYSIFNDWDGGMMFWPDGAVNDEKVFMPIDIIRIKEFFSTYGSYNKIIKFPDLEPKLKDIVNNLDESDNPLLMIVKLKPNQ
jgi:hypothetical protein